MTLASTDRARARRQRAWPHVGAWAVVTGASSGIGAGFARRLAARGSHVVLVARDVERLHRLAASIAADADVQVEVLGADLLIAREVERVVQRLADADRPVAVLVNNAGIGTRGPFVELDLAGELQQLHLNVAVPLRLMHAAATVMTASGCGAIVNVSSFAGFQPTPLTATYGAGKAFVTRVSEALHEELRAHGVVVTVACPSFTTTEFHERAGIDVSRIPKWAWLSPDRVADDALEAVRHRRALSVPGLGYKALARAVQVAPAGTLRRASAVFSRVR